VARSRSRSEGLQRSVSRELYKEPVTLDSFKKEVASQHEYLVELIKEHKTQVDEKLASKSRKFASKQIEKQFQVNFTFKELATKIQQAHAVKDYEKAEEAADELADKLEEHAQDLIIADSSPHGWLAVSKLRHSTELPKAVRKRLAAVEKELASKKIKNGGPRRKFQQQQQQLSTASQDGFTKNRKFSPEEALFAASKQVRAGTCSHCHKEYHYYRECPTFWSKVHESRAAKAKGAAAASAD
jgi:Zn-dependent M16 (insulinase) family peptidase